MKPRLQSFPVYAKLSAKVGNCVIVVEVLVKVLSYPLDQQDIFSFHFGEGLMFCAKMKEQSSRRKATGEPCGQHAAKRNTLLALNHCTVSINKIISGFFVIMCVMCDVHGQDTAVSRQSKDTALTKIDTMKAAVVTAAMRPRVRGDTMEYNTEHVRMHANAVIEDLLRRLPGLRIDADGTIYYNGEKIDHLLLDGEDMSGSDPTLITRNFDADKIARVQVLDRKSDQARLTGVDDGVRVKTLNLVLKAEAKDGYFGKLEAGGNSDGYYNGNVAVAGFHAREQFTALGLATNTGVLGFSSSAGGVPAGLSFHNDNTDLMGASAGIGVPHFDALALHYANRWGMQDDHFSGNYQFSHYYSEPVAVSQTLQTEPGSIYSSDQHSRSMNRQDEHWFYGTYEGPGFLVIFQGTDAVSENKLVANGSGSFNDTLTNMSLRTVSDNASKRDPAGRVTWHTQVGRKAGRIISLGGTFTDSHASTDGYLYSINQFFHSGSGSPDTVDQRKSIADETRNVGGFLNFNEPLWKEHSLGLGYSFIYNEDRPVQATYGRGNGKYLDFIDSLSSSLPIGAVTQRVTTNVQGRSGHFAYTVGNDWMDYRLSGYGHYTSFNPRLLANYNPNAGMFMHFEYTGTTMNPTIAQLNPATNNNDPLHVFIGNPGLKPQVTRGGRFVVHSARRWLVDLSIGGSVIDHAISLRTTTDSLGRQVSESVNVEGNKTGVVNLTVTRRVFGVDLGGHFNESYNRYVQYINSELNRCDALTTGGGISLSRYKPDKFSIQINTDISYFDQPNSVNAAAPLHYWSTKGQGALSLFFIKDFEINTNAVYTWQGKAGGFSSNTSVLMWNAFVSRNLLHNRLVARFQVNNLLDADAGVIRSNTGNVNTQSFTNILGRYWMVSAIYHFDRKFGRR